ncbi:MAG: ribonuclease PH [Micavibrio sp.]|nr:MAG: ribonuclease PH [Micavibrio sp.]
MVRPSGRQNDELRRIVIETQNITKHAEGACLIKCGDTHVLCTATVEDRLPNWLKGQGKGWVTAEYGMLPRSTGQRMQREAARGKQSGRTQEIQRLIGRALRAVVDLKKMPDIQIVLDCDVLQADGGTRTAAITGAYVAMAQAVRHLLAIGAIKETPIIDSVAAISCGLYQGQSVLDLDYAEDSTAEADANFVLTGKGGIVEVQATAEETAFAEERFFELLKLAQKGVRELAVLQQKSIQAAEKDAA